MRNMGLDGSPVEDGAKPIGDVVVVVESQHGVSLGEGLGQFTSVALGHAPNRYNRLSGSVALEVCGRQQGVDGVLLGLLDESAGVDDDRLGLAGVVDETEPASLHAGRKLLGIDVVAGAAHRHEMDCHEVITGRHETPF